MSEINEFDDELNESLQPSKECESDEHCEEVLL